jgi:diguanylate cyclase (GGDEF)-like protein
MASPPTRTHAALSAWLAVLLLLLGVGVLIAAMSVDSAAPQDPASRWLLVLSSLSLAAGLAAVALLHQRWRPEARRREQAEREAETSHCELNDSIEALTALSRNMQRLSAYASLLQSCQRSEEALDITRISVSALLPQVSGTVYVQDESVADAGDGAVAKAATCWGEHRLPSAPKLETRSCWGLRRVQPFGFRDPADGPCCEHIQLPAAHDPRQVASLCLPLNAQGDALGMLYLSGPPEALDEALATTAAEQLSMALANLKLKETLHNQSIRDALTGLFNRRFLEGSLARELARASRKQQTLAVLMLDVDHFKRFNDSHGHPGGDALLTAVGGVLRQLSRPEDIPCRYGGEEFTLILPDTDAATAVARGERIREAIAALRVAHEGKPLSVVTASIGVAVFPDHHAEMEPLLEAADGALYRAKAEGRNRVVLAATARA